MLKVSAVVIENKELESWLNKRTAPVGVTMASTVRDALAALMKQEKESKK